MGVNSVKSTSSWACCVVLTPPLKVLEFEELKLGKYLLKIDFRLKMSFFTILMQD